MKKSALIFVMPAILALASCSSVSVPQKGNLMAEDTLVHEEIFGAAREAGELGLQRTGVRKAVDFSVENFVKMGYQINFDNKNDADDSNDTISIRFVAAIKDSGVRAIWHRAIAQPNGYEGAEVSTGNWKFKLSDNTESLGIESSKLYSTLTDGSNTISTSNDPYTGYAGFVIYTLRNIPYNAYKESYFGAYLELRDASNESTKLNSDFAAVKIEKSGSYASANVFKFDIPSHNEKHFLQGKINGSENAIKLESGTIIDSASNFASYNDIELKAGDYFGSYYFKIDFEDPLNQEKNHFQFFGHDNFFDQSLDFFNEASLKGYNAPKADGTYDLLVSKGDGHVNDIYTVDTSVEYEYTINGMPDWIRNAGGGGATPLFAWVWSVKNTGFWVELEDYATYDSGGTKYSAKFTVPGGYQLTGFLLARCSYPTTTPSYSVKGDDAGRIYNKTGDVTVTKGTFTYSCSDWPGYNPA